MKILSNYLEFINENLILPQRVGVHDFFKKERELNREKFTSREISELNKIDFAERYLIPLHKLEKGYISDNISFKTQCHLFYVILIKLEDEWYLIEERPQKVMLEAKYFICDGFEQVVNYINHINEKFK